MAISITVNKVLGEVTITLQCSRTKIFARIDACCSECANNSDDHFLSVSESASDSVSESESASVSASARVRVSTYPNLYVSCKFW